MIKIFTMVKDECDIIEHWILYHSKIFGIENIHVIDNMSTDGTYEIIEKFKDKGLNVTRLPDYKLKGTYITNIMRNFKQDEFLIPIDIDEFICLYKNNEIIVDKDTVINYIHSLPEHKLYKMHYILAKVQDENGFEGANAFYGTFQSGYEHRFLKSFVSAKYKQNIDHGNHMISDNFFLTELCLIHYHFRNLDQYKKRSIIMSLV